MAHPRFSRPAINAAIAALVTLLSWSAVAWGLQSPGVLTAAEGSPAAGAIGIGLAPAIIAPMMFWLYLKGARTVRAARAGEGVIARWTVTANEIAAFRANNAARNRLGSEYRNDWKPPRRDPAEGIDVIFLADAVVIGGMLYPLVNTGMIRFAGVQVLGERPLAIEFGIVSSTFLGKHTVRTRSVLRLPAARLARDDLPRVLEHFRQVDAREIVVNPEFYQGRRRFGLIAAPICFAIAAAAFVVTPKSVGPEGVTLQIVGLTVTIAGVICGIGALVLAWVAQSLRQGQLPRR